MHDREKLTDAMNDVKAVENFLRKQGESWYADILSDAFDTLATLREQELVRFKVTRQDKSYPFWDSVCTGCGYKTSTVKDCWKYCPVCGKRVKWDD